MFHSTTAYSRVNEKRSVHINTGETIFYKHSSQSLHEAVVSFNTDSILIGLTLTIQARARQTKNTRKLKLPLFSTSLTQSSTIVGSFVLCALTSVVKSTPKTNKEETFRQSDLTTHDLTNTQTYEHVSLVFFVR